MESNSWNKTNQWSEELDALHAIIQKTELIEATKWGGTVYTYNNKNVLGIGGFKNYFTIWFFNGVFLKDEANVLVNAQEGVTKSLRQWRFTSKSELNEKLILHYIQEAIAVEKAGLKIKPEKKPIPVSVFFDEVLNSDSLLKENFLKLTPYKQKEYIEFIESAKQEKTKISRMEKIKPMILSQKGLNDKYK